MLDSAIMAEVPATSSGTSARPPHESEPHGARGHSADSPREIPAAGWKDIALRVKDEIGADKLSLLSAGVAFYAFLALIPALGAIISVWGLFADPTQIQAQMSQLTGTVPEAGVQLIERAATRIAESSSTSLGWGLVISLLLTLWSANRGMKGLLDAVHAAYGEDDDRGFLAKNAISLVLTLGAVIVTVLAMAMIIAVPAALAYIGLSTAAEWAISLARWPILAAIVVVGLAVIYRVGPQREDARWRWVSPGAIFAAVAWVVASILFSIYVENFGSYNKTYGSVAAVAVLLMWFFISAFIVLLGAEINSEAEKQTEHDTTTGQARPMGKRGAVSADTVAERPTLH